MAPSENGTIVSSNNHKVCCLLYRPRAATPPQPPLEPPALQMGVQRVLGLLVLFLVGTGVR